MRHRSSFAIYIAHKRLCDRLEQAARNKPTSGADPINNFIEAASTGSVIEWRNCSVVAERLEQLSADWLSLGELTRPVQSMARRLRTAANAEIPFYLR